MIKKRCKEILIGCMFFLFLAACSPLSEPLIAKQYAEAVLTKNNELQFRFKINENMLTNEMPYKVKVSIHNQELAGALGTKEIIYGQELVYAGAYLEARGDGSQYIYMAPISLKKDLHPFEIEKMIVKEGAITVEVFNDQQILGKAPLKNFSTQL
jgi:hypothetical protein